MIVGPGALGCAFAEQLQPHHTISLYGPRPPQGARFLRWYQPEMPALTEPTLVILACKSVSLDSALSQHLAPALKKSDHQALSTSMVLAPQNGLGVSRFLRERLPRELAFCRALAWFGARWAQERAPLELQISPAPRRLTLAASTRSAQLEVILSSAGFSTELWPDSFRHDSSEPITEKIAKEIEEEIEWKKGLTSLALNALLAFHRKPNGALLEDLTLQAQARELQREAFLVFHARGLKRLTPEQAWQDLLRTCTETSQNRNSMLQDLEAGRALELNALNGALVDQARALGLHLRAHEALLQALIKT
ncbi:MAG: hypothetical protein RJB38_1106 [Pseudomonadota bacterium]|jgi:2-dehydropantoate 2-reductase